MTPLTYFMSFFQEARHLLVRGVLRDGSARKIFSDRQFGIFPAELHLGVVKTNSMDELVPEEIRS